MSQPILMNNEFFFLEVDTVRNGLTVFKRINDAYDTNYLRSADTELLGNLVLRYQAGNEKQSRSWSTRESKAQFEASKHALQWQCENEALRVTEGLVLEGKQLCWWFELTNTAAVDVCIQDLELPLAFNQAYVKDAVTTYTQRVVRHSFCSLDGSFIYWCRPNGEGPMLTLVPEAGTSLEYCRRDWDQEGIAWEGPYSVFIHSRAAVESTQGQWKFPSTSLVLQPGQTRRYAFRFAWAKDHDDVHRLLYELDSVDAIAVPGMTVTPQMQVKLALRSRQQIVAVKVPHSGTAVFMGEKGGYRIYEVSFSRMGENPVEICFGQNRRMFVEFFVTHPIRELMEIRAQHLVKKQQYRGERWYNGLFSQWDMKHLQFVTPDNQMGVYRYVTGGADDPGLCKAPWLAEKNLAYPVEDEIAAIEYYIEHFLWGGLQRTDQELPRPYGIYGTDFWIEQRNSGTGFDCGGHGEDRMWRTFDYMHIAQLYYYMYRIAALYPDKVHYLDASGYLERAYQTAMAVYKIPISIFMDEKWAIQGYSDWAYKQGNFNELVIPWIIDALEMKGRSAEAAALRAEWETKVRYMVYDHPYPFGSEMWFDTTAFESTHAVAKYGVEHGAEPDPVGFYDPNFFGPGKGKRLPPHMDIRQEDFAKFMERELIANKAARGVIEPTFELLGSDYRQAGNSNYTLSYMTQMGGWGLFDAAAYYSPKPAEDMRLAYACYLAGWMLVHTGGDYPWYPSEENRGAAGWAFEPAQMGSPWIGRNFSDPRGPWRLDGEIDCGFSGAIRTAASVLVDDPLFGRYLYGGKAEETDTGLLLRTADGLNQRLHVLLDGVKLHLELDRDGWSSIAVEQDQLVLNLENRTMNAHQTFLTISGDLQQTIAISMPAQPFCQVKVPLNGRILAQ